jgi:hypothetical protein
MAVAALTEHRRRGIYNLVETVRGGLAMKLEVRGWKIEVPTGWAMAAASDQTWLRLFFEGEARNIRDTSTVESRGTEISLQLLPLPASTAVEAVTDAIMLRHVGYQLPERTSRSVGGRPALAYAWTDGVDDIESQNARRPSFASTSRSLGNSLTTGPRRHEGARPRTRCSRRSPGRRRPRGPS